MTRFLIALLRIYRKLISPVFPYRCRFYPSCSLYFIEALEKKGWRRGIFLGIRRILSCHPFNPGGYDPVE